MGVSVDKKRVCPHLSPRHRTETAVRPMVRPAATRENTTVEPLCRLTDGARLPRADSPAPGKHTKPLQKWADAEPANRSTPSRWERCRRWASPTGLPTRGNPTRSRVGGGQDRTSWLPMRSRRPRPKASREWVFCLRLLTRVRRFQLLKLPKLPKTIRILLLFIDHPCYPPR